MFIYEKYKRMLHFKEQVSIQILNNDCQNAAGVYFSKCESISFTLMPIFIWSCLDSLAVINKVSYVTNQAKSIDKSRDKMHNLQEISQAK